MAIRMTALHVSIQQNQSVTYKIVEYVLTGHGPKHSIVTVQTFLAANLGG